MVRAKRPPGKDEMDAPSGLRSASGAVAAAIAVCAQATGASLVGARPI
jgi:hypothetical protein